MTRNTFKQLQVGDRVTHPATGPRTIIAVESVWEYAGDTPRETTWAITVSGGNRMKIDDHEDVARLQRVD